MARVELPESRLRLRKRRRRVRITLVLAAFVLLCAAAVAGVARIPGITISTITVTGAQTLSSTTIQAFVRERLAGNYLLVIPKSNIFLYPKQTIAADLAQAYPLLASADVHAQDFHTIAVNLVERQPRALWCPAEGSCFFMDESGVVYAEAPRFSEPVYTVYAGALPGDALPKQYLKAGEFAALSALVDALAHKIPDERLESVAVDENNDVGMRFSSGFSLRFALADEGGDVFERFALALTAEPLAKRKLSDFEYLDLRFGDKLYYKLRD